MAPVKASREDPCESADDVGRLGMEVKLCVT